MGKIRLNLTSGAVVEKPLINAFKANNNSYIVLDNEMNGSMGLPIILVSKFENERLIKIIDQGEWQIVKEYLKNIIAGNPIEFIPVGNVLAADDIYYTQLTLPVLSFDALKNAYKVEDGNANSALENVSEVVNNVAETENVDLTPPVTPQVEVPVENPVVEPVVNPSAPVIDLGIPVQPEVNVTEINSAPEVDLNIPMPTFGESIQPSPVEVSSVNNNLEPEITPTPVIDASIPNVSNEVNVFREQKEAFMQACENMFDALVQKFEKELENRK